MLKCKNEQYLTWNMIQLLSESWSQLDESLHMHPSLYQNNEAITLSEFTRVLTRLCSSKTPGEDSINSELFMYASQETS
jgi:hypothetical protein